MTISMEKAKNLITMILEMGDSSEIPALVGLSGDGKTQIVKQVAKDTNRTLIKFNASQLQEGDLAMPFKTSMDTVTYAINESLKTIFDKPEDEYLVFIDEFNRSKVGVINEMMTMLNENVLSGYEFPKTVRFIAAMNPVSSMEGFEDTDYAVSEMDDAHYNRFILIGVENSVNEWLEYMGERANKNIVEFFSEFSNHKLFRNKDKESVQIATPRAWEHISNQLNFADDNDIDIQSEEFRELIAGQIGRTKMNIFLKWVSENVVNIKPEEILTGKKLTAKVLKSFKGIKGIQQKSIFESCLPYFEDNKKKLDTKAALTNAENMWKLFVATLTIFLEYSSLITSL